VNHNHSDPSRLNASNPLFLFINNYLNISSSPPASILIQLISSQENSHPPSTAVEQVLPILTNDSKVDAHTKPRSLIPQQIPRTDFSPILTVIQENDDNNKYLNNDIHASVSKGEENSR
jgi:hypothetical protein